MVGCLECEPCYAPELIQLPVRRAQRRRPGRALRERDELYEPAIEIVVREGAAACRCYSARSASATAGRRG